ncbi:acyl-CoA dehydrogenase family protein [Rhodoligotrophos defluvii]|uniref:acyl-CoA dehydrogenase family protein n=1 Tax=Rhodoligotrophos defluvii TaxID=2561934 RepID=UPI0010C95619|nr:acyl-CoA dehydrogenase family protein [Rhodoligotrophos defluvii]
MEFALSEEQTLLRDSVRRFVAEAHDFGRGRALAQTEEGFSRAHWVSFAELGWLALLVPETMHGLGGKSEDAAILMEELGRGLLAAPYLSTAVLGADLIVESQLAERLELLEQLMAGTLLVAVATEESHSRYDLAAVNTTARRDSAGAFLLSGRKIMVLDGAAADGFIVSARFGDETGSGDIALFWVPADTAGLEIRRYRTIDDRRACDLGLDQVRLPAAALLAGPECGLAHLGKAMDRARVLMAAEAIGAMDSAIEMTAEYLRTRHQFGRALASFQVLAHRLSDMFVKLENARSMLFRGLAMLDAPADVRAAAVSATMITIIQAGEFVTGQAIQLHGGIGMADESPVGHYYKRLRAIGKTFGDLSWHMNRYLRITSHSSAQGAA